jgi:Predicted permeases
MFQLYSYTLPDIIFYTLPLSFVAALTNVLMRLSLDNELIALYALGLKADKILRSLFVLGLLFSLLLLFVSFLAMPLSKQYYQSFKTAKQAEAKLNIVPGKLGQRFGDYYVYVKENKDDVFHTIVIYNRTNKDQETSFSLRIAANSTKNTIKLRFYSMRDTDILTRAPNCSKPNTNFFKFTTQPHKKISTIKTYLTIGHRQPSIKN